MPKLSNPANNSSPGATQAVTPADAEPDVTWGEGGIDDWGWTALKQADDDPAPPPELELA
jgi:hypothetical protein